MGQSARQDQGTSAVAAEYFVTEVYPALVPTTRTFIVSARSAATRVYVFAVAPVIATPERYHW